MYSNGFIVREKVYSEYFGVENNNWFLKEEKLSEFVDKNIDSDFDDAIACSNDIEFIVKYCNECRKNTTSFEVIFCQTDLKSPIIKQIVEMETEFLGYDYAYPAGSYYSAVYNDIISRRFTIFRDVILNGYGLFDDVNDLLEFVKLREKIKNKQNSLPSRADYIEDGCFVTYKISKVKSVVYNNQKIYF